MDAHVQKHTHLAHMVTSFLCACAAVSRDADSILAWIESKIGQATSTEYGEDLAEVEELTTKHETLVSSLTAFEAKRVADLTALKKGLIKERNTKAIDIEARYNVVMERWEQIMAASHERDRSLAASYVPDLYHSCVSAVVAQIVAASEVCATLWHNVPRLCASLLIITCDCAALPQVQKV